MITIIVQFIPLISNSVLCGINKVNISNIFIIIINNTQLTLWFIILVIVLYISKKNHHISKFCTSGLKEI